MIRLSRIALGPMRQRTCITLHSSTDVQSAAARARSCTYVRTYPRYTWIARDYGYHADDWIKCISHARIDHTRRAHILYHPDPGSAVPAEYFRMRSRDEGVIPRSLRPKQPHSCDRESRSWL